MRAVEAHEFSLDALKLGQRPVPRLRRGEILIRVKAVSLNYRDLAVLTGTYIPGLPLPLVPASDACGEVVAVGEDVTRFVIGDRVTPIYTQGWHDGLPTPEQRAKRTLGQPLDGVLQEFIAVPAEDAVLAPGHLSPEEASTLPVAGLTAWSALSEGNVKPGDTVLVQGSGGVALFALQFAKAAGARVIATSSSDSKLDRMKTLGADVGINYRTNNDWAKTVRDETGGRGADIVVETGGSTLPQSLTATAFGGFVAVVGFVAGYEATIQLRQLIGPMVRVQGIAVGSRARFESMNRAMAINGIRPVIDSVHDIGEAGNAFKHMKAGAHFGKVVITL
ncbi:NAD(P)-dependent alcohol dehydrogenase [Agrobacterium tumefaciens]|nr:NAD(P)-dependent alcohol dehydrogenase [Agrobacterium tumefaciens]NTC42978.1 NAD(P)-dependent alcohol dehydrogenase [Agrobacterium tumefaciens]